MAMIERNASGVYLKNGIPSDAPERDTEAREKTMAYRILRKHEKKRGTDGRLPDGRPRTYERRQYEKDSRNDPGSHHDRGRPARFGLYGGD